ncbi:hypothetical protein LCM4579_22460 [Ensifer sp. LCM 4579]|nr:hypothetical protein LCM4579_22460 [Ensifer sp. LCM 4579]
MVYGRISAGFLAPTSGATSLSDIKSFKHLLEPKVLCTKLFSQQTLEALVVCVQGGKLVEGDRIVDSPGLRLSILVPNLRVEGDRLCGGRLARFRGVPADVVRRRDAGWLSCTCTTASAG